MRQRQDTDINKYSAVSVC